MSDESLKEWRITNGIVITNPLCDFPKKLSDQSSKKVIAVGRHAYEKGFDIEKLATYPLSGGQIRLIVKNTALKVAIKAKPIFCFDDFKLAIDREAKGAFGDVKSVGFMN